MPGAVRFELQDVSKYWQISFRIQINATYRYYFVGYITFGLIAIVTLKFIYGLHSILAKFYTPFRRKFIEAILYPLKFPSLPS
jgi:hypothetical protein